MKIITLIIGITLGATATTMYHLVARPDFWQNAVKVSEIKFESPTTTAFKTQEAKEAAFSVSKGTRCYAMEDKSSSFARLDPKDNTVLEMLVICPGLGAGWVKGI